MNTPLDRQIRLAEVAQRYYVDRWSQQAIARHMGTTRSNVSRLLETARREGVVRFVVDHPLHRHPDLESKLMATFGVREALVLSGPSVGLDLIGRLASNRLLDALPPGGRIAIGWGSTVQAVVNATTTPEPLDAEVVQVGGNLTMPSAASGHELVRQLAQAIGGRHRFLHAPALVESEAVAAGFRADPRIALELELARTADVALVGIGLPGVGFAETAVLESYEGEERPEAIVCARLINETGEELHGPLRDRVVALDLSDLASIPTTIAAAAGAAKGPAIAAALRGGFIDVLVCDQEAAATALSPDSNTLEAVSHATT